MKKFFKIFLSEFIDELLKDDSDNTKTSEIGSIANASNFDRSADVDGVLVVMRDE